MQQEYKSGFVTLIGRSNVGKSTLVNAMVGEKVAIVSDRPQTTRNQIRGVLHRPDYQIVFIDTPGLHRPHNRLGQFMVRSAGAALEDVDVALAVMDASVPVGGGDRAVMDRSPIEPRPFAARKAFPTGEVLRDASILLLHHRLLQFLCRHVF